MRKTTAAKGRKKEAQGQPGEVGATLSRRMGPALAEIFSESGVQLYSESVLAIKQHLQEIFTNAINGLESTIKEELGRRGQSESAAHFGPWIQGLVEDVVQFGMPEVGGALEDLASSLTAEFVSEETEAGDEEMLGLEEEAPEEEEVGVVEEEPVEEPAPEEAPAEEAPGLEELMAPAEEAEAPAAALKPRTYRLKVPKHKRVAHSEEHATLELDDLFRAAGKGKLVRGRVAIKRKAKTAAQAKKVLEAVQARVVKQIAARFGAVTEVDPAAIDEWVKKAYASKGFTLRKE